MTMLLNVRVAVHRCCKQIQLSLLIVAVLGSISAPLALVAQEATPRSESCDATHPNNVKPPEHLEHYVNPNSTFYMEGIWVGLWPEGVMFIDRQGTISTGEFQGWRAQKMWWTRDDGVEGDLIVTGERLDGESPDAVHIWLENQYGPSGFTPVTLAFPDQGCWRITGRVGEHTIEFVMQVKFVETYPWLATPVS